MQTKKVEVLLRTKKTKKIRRIRKTRRTRRRNIDVNCESCAKSAFVSLLLGLFWAAPDVFDHSGQPPQIAHS